MQTILINFLMLIPSGEHEGRPTYNVIDTRTNTAIEHAYIEEVKAYILTSKFEYDEQVQH